MLNKNTLGVKKVRGQSEATMVILATKNYKGGQVTKPIIVVKVPCKLLYVIQVKEFLIKCSTSWPYLISEFLVANITIVTSDWPRTFFTPKVLLFSITYVGTKGSDILNKHSLAIK